MTANSAAACAPERRLRGRRGLRFPRPSRRYAIFLIVSAAFGLAMFQRMGLAAIAGSLRSDLGLNAEQLGSLGSSYFYIYALMQLPLGVVVDRWGARRVLAALLGIATLGGFIFALAPSYTWLLVGRSLVGLGVSAAFLSSIKLIAAWFPTKDLALWTGLFLAVSDLGAILAGRPLVEMMRYVGWSGAYLLAAILTGLTAAAAWFLVREQPDSRMEREGTLPPQPHSGVSRQELLAVMRSPIVWIMGLGFFFCSGTQVSFQAVWGGPYLADVYRLPAAVVGNLLMLIPLGRAVGNLVHGWLADRVLHSRMVSMTIGLALYVAGWVPLAFMPAGISTSGLAAIYCGGFGFSWVTVMLVFPILRARFSGRVAGTASGIVNMLSLVGAATIQQGFGVLINRYPQVQGAYPVAAYQTAFGIGLAMAAAGWLVIAGASASVRRR